MKITINQNQINSLCNKQDISYLGLFGSHSRGDERVDSDVDLLVDFNETKSYFELANVQEELENIFQKKIDLVLKSNIKEVFKENIFKDLKTLYEQK